jgi:hypothetical protein
MVNLTSTLAAVIGLAALTSAVPTLEKRAVTCRDDLGPGSFGKVSNQASERRVGNQGAPIANRCSPCDHSQASEAVECINYLASLGNQPCVATVSGQSFCRRGNTQITGLARNGNTATSSW